MKNLSDRVTPGTPIAPVEGDAPPVEEYSTTLLDLYQAAWLCLRGFAPRLTMLGNRVAFSFTGAKREIDLALDDYFVNGQVQQYVSHVRNLKIALHERLRREGL